MLIFFNSWIAFTLGLYYFGPIPWTYRVSYLVAVIVLGTLLAFNAGARFGSRLPALPQRDFATLNKPRSKWALIVGFIFLSEIHIQSLTGQSILNPFNYSLNFNAIYSQFQDIVKDRTFSAGSIESMLLLLKAMMMPSVIILLVVNFPKDRVAILALLFPFVGSSMMRGTDKETVDIALYLLILAYYNNLLGRRAVKIIVLFAVVILLFVSRKMARFEGISLSCLPGTPEACFNFDNALSIYISPTLEFMRIMLTNYVTQGYEGMARALTIPFEFNFMLGHMAPVQQKMCQVFDVFCGVQSFNDKLPELGWDTRYKWSSAYTSIANDTHWLFLPVYTFILGTIFGVSEKSWRTNRDYLSLACLLLISIFVIYSSANMQMTASLEWTAVYLVLMLWQASRIVRNRATSSQRDVQQITGAP